MLSGFPVTDPLLRWLDDRRLPSPLLVHPGERRGGMSLAQVAVTDPLLPSPPPELAPRRRAR